MTKFDPELLVASVQWFGAGDPAVAHIDPLDRQIALCEAWPDVRGVSQVTHLESAIARMVLGNTPFGEQVTQSIEDPNDVRSAVPEGFSVHLRDVWADVTFARTEDFVAWMGEDVARYAFTGQKEGLSHWAFLGRGIVCLGVRAREVLDVTPPPYQDPSLWQTHVVAHIAPLKPEFAALLPQAR